MKLTQSLIVTVLAASLAAGLAGTGLVQADHQVGAIIPLCQRPLSVTTVSSNFWERAEWDRFSSPKT